MSSTVLPPHPFPVTAPPTAPHTGGALDQYSPPNASYPPWPMLPNARHMANSDPYATHASYGYAPPQLATPTTQMLEPMTEYQLPSMVQPEKPLDNNSDPSGLWIGNNLAQLRRKAFEHQFVGIPSFRV